MKKLLLLTVIIVASCTTGNNIRKQIIQHIEAEGLGMVKVDKISQPEHINDSTFKATHSFKNTLINQEVRITNIYYFNTDLSQIKTTETTKTELKSAGDWVEADL